MDNDAAADARWAQASPASLVATLTKHRRGLPAHLSPSRRFYVLLFAAWALLTLGSLGFALHAGIQQAERDLEHHARSHFVALRDKLRDNEATVHAFAAHLASVPEARPQQIRALARRLLEPHAHIYMLELVERVPRDALEGFVRQARTAWNPDFTPKTFDYLRSRTWQPLSEKDTYYLLVMMEPDLPGAKEVYGLDTDSVPFLRTSLRESLRLGVPIASEPFRLAEDASLAYVMYRPVPAGAGRPPGGPGGDRLALLVVRVESLFPSIVLDPANHYRLFYDLRPMGGGEQTLHVHPPARPVGDLARWMLPVLRVRHEIESKRQPVGMEIRRQLGFTDLHGVALPVIAVFSLLSLVLILLYLRVHGRLLAMQREAYVEARHQALHDPLTGLGNRVQLRDRLDHALRLAQRSRRPLALLYLDLDGFKQVNDRHGHAAGDALLIETARRLRAILRETDSVARVGGDEFVVLLESIESAQDVPSVVDKLRQALGRPYVFEGLVLQVRVSVGICLYPEQAETAEALLLAADRDMYRDKQDGGLP